jgi:hypothetical protein
VRIAVRGEAPAGEVVGLAVSYRASGSGITWRSQFQVDFVGYGNAD